jgi:hypothetical protein
MIETTAVPPMPPVPPVPPVPPQQLALEQAERMASWVCAYGPATRVEGQYRGAEFDDLLPRLTGISNFDVQMRFLRVCAVRLSRRPVIRHALEREDQAG